jgi:hypothetical protein
MGERVIGDLLEELDKAYPEHKLTIHELEERNIPLDVIYEASQRDLIRKADPQTKVQPFDNHINKYIDLFLTINGFEYLNQIRIKKTIEQFMCHRLRIKNGICFL